MLASLLCSLALAACGRSPSITLALLGDLSLGRQVHPAVDSLAFISKDLSSADLALANLESPLAKDPPEVLSGYNLCAQAAFAGLLGEWGLGALTIANNHARDCIEEGLARTSFFLSTAGLDSAATDAPLLVEINGIRLAILAFDDISSSLDGAATAEAICAARAQSDLVLVSVHWGMEYQAEATIRQQDLATQMVNAGASLVWGHHPHVLQKAALIQPVDNSNVPALALYSLGNALFDQGGLPDTRQSALVLVRLDKKGYISIRAIPFEIDTQESRLVQPDEATSKQILDRLALP